MGSGALALVLVLAVGIGAWVWQGSRDVGVPVGGPSTAATESTTGPSADSGVPPVALTLESLDAASRGWVTWDEGTEDVVDVTTCWPKV